MKMRGLSSVAGGGSSVGILTATRKATLAVRSAFACHTQPDAREGVVDRLGAGVQRFACRGGEGDRYKADALVPPTRSLAALGMTNGCLGMTNGRLGMTNGCLGMTNGRLGNGRLGVMAYPRD